MKSARHICATALAMVALAACSGSDTPEKSNSVPYQWIRQEYTAGVTGYVDTVDLPDRVADEINGHASARDRSTGGTTVFLRYSDDIVAIAPHERGSVIEVADYRTGYYRWGKSLPSAWPHPDSAQFRGGGPGSGK
ncbi:DUF4247 domain-containing protein [Streptomyces sp. NPDC004838]